MERDPLPDVPLSEEDFGGRVFDNFFKMYFQPELDRRVAEGKLELPANIAMGQVVFPEGGVPIVRLDEEVRIAARMSVPLTDMTDAETGNLTTLDGLEQKIDRAEEFFLAAKEAKIRGHTAVAFDNLFSATELLSRVHLEIHSSIRKGTKTHSSVASGINRWSKLGNVPAEFTTVFNKAANVRDQARYRACSNDQLVLTDEELAIVDREIKLLRNQCAGLERTSVG